MRDASSDGDLRTDSGGQIIFRGCNIAKEDTVRTAIANLERVGLITRWLAPRSGWSNTYMPFSEDWLAEDIVSEGGVVPQHNALWLQGEKLVHRNGNYQLIDVQDDDSALAQKLDSRLRPLRDTERLCAGSFRRMTAKEVVENRERPPSEFWGSRAR